MKKGFTILELLLSVSIIAIISCIMLETQLFNNKERINKMHVRQGYNTITNIVSDMMQDAEKYPEQSLIKDNNNQLTQGHRYFCTNFTDYLNIFEEPNCANQDDIAFTSTNNIDWYIKRDNNNNHIITIDIDNDGGNCVQSVSCDDPDRFSFSVNPDGKISIPDSDKQEKLIEYLTNR